MNTPHQNVSDLQRKHDDLGLVRLPKRAEPNSSLQLDAAAGAVPIMNGVTFPEKLMELLMNETDTEALWWLPGGDVFALHAKRFTKTILANNFQGSKFESFTRKLARWGFQRIPSKVSSNAYLYKHPLFRRDDPDRCKEISGSNKKWMSPVRGAKQLPKDVANALVKPFPVPGPAPGPAPWPTTSVSETAMPAPSPAAGPAAWPTTVVGNPAPGFSNHWPMHSNRFPNLTSPNSGHIRQPLNQQNVSISSFAAQRTAETVHQRLQPANRVFTGAPHSNRFATRLQELELENILENPLYARSMAIRQSQNAIAAARLSDQLFAEQRLTPAMAATALCRAEQARYRRAVSETAPAERRLMTNGLETSLSSSNLPRFAALEEGSINSRLATSLPNLWTDSTPFSSATTRAHLVSSAFLDRTPISPVGPIPGLSLQQRETSGQDIGLIREELMLQVFLRRQRES